MTVSSMATSEVAAASAEAAASHMWAMTPNIFAARHLAVGPLCEVAAAAASAEAASGHLRAWPPLWRPHSGITAQRTGREVTAVCIVKNSRCALGPTRRRNYYNILNKRARVSLTLRLICGYLLRSLLPFLTFLLWNITGS